MKKIIALSTLAVSLAAPSVFGQGWLQLTSGFSQSLDGFTTPGTLLRDSLVNVALLWAPSGTVNPMPLANTPTTEPFTTPTGAWSDIYPGGTILSGWQVALDAGNDGNTAGSQVIVQTTSRGAVGYAAGAGFDITGTTASGTITLMELSFPSSMTLASAIGSGPIGWSYLSSYTLAASSTDTGISTPTFTNFGTFPVTVPEPATLALAGLGGLSLLLFRRKKA